MPLYNYSIAASS
ncbi:uncharacterized protein FPRN_15233 [Fusarium proliferatum]|nr:uncharacterized protein FPRN_15233 [Fusarium proliferatum]